MRAHDTRSRRTSSNALCILVFLLILTPRVRGQATRVDVIQFDVILELHAPLAHMDIALFLRYWVSRDFYSVAIIWGEPAGTAFNFPTQPMAVVLDSNAVAFSVKSRLQPDLTSVFPKPTGERGIFRHALNAYPLGDMRFAEGDALASRVYRSDLRGVIEDVNDSADTGETTHEIDVKGTGRQVKDLKARVVGDRLEAIELIDANGLPMKSIAYEYIGESSGSLLTKLNVILPGRPMTVGYRGKGATIRINDRRETYRELPAVYHQGGRRATVVCQSLDMSSGMISVPVDVTVVKADANTVLRTAHMSNYLRTVMSQSEATRAADRFARLDENAMLARAMVDRCWLKQAGDLNDVELSTVRRLRTHFEAVTPRGETVGEQLRRINLLLDMDQIQAHAALQKHFRQYLAILIANDLPQMVLVGGISRIENVVRWRHMEAADRLLAQWLDATTAVHSPSSIIDFAEAHQRAGPHWPIARLIEESLISQDWGSTKFVGQALRCLLLGKSYEACIDPATVKTEQAKAEAQWIDSSLGVTRLGQELRKALSDADNRFAEITEPGPREMTLMKQLDVIRKKIDENHASP